MPNQDGFGPMGRGPLTGRGRGRCHSRGGFGRRFSRGGQFMARDLEGERDALKEELKAVEQAIEENKK